MKTVASLLILGFVVLIRRTWTKIPMTGLKCPDKSVEYVGRSVIKGSTRSKSWEHCGQLCAENPQCEIFARDGRNKKCFLRKGFSKRIIRKSYTSGNRSCAISVSIKFTTTTEPEKSISKTKGPITSEAIRPCPEIGYHYKPVNYLPYRWVNHPVNSWRKCRLICLEMPLCEYFVFRGSCAVRAKGAIREKYPGRISGHRKCLMPEPKLSGDVCFTNNITGSTSETCGPEDAPCKSLHQCLGGGRWSKQVVVVGKQFVGGVISVLGSVTIIGRDNATIVGWNATSIEFEGNHVSIKSLRVEDLGILVAGSQNATIDSCVFERSRLTIASVKLSTVKNSCFQNFKISEFQDANPMMGHAVGALSIKRGDVSTVENCTFTRNWIYVFGVDSKGGALYVTSVKTNTIKYCSFVNNTAKEGGALYINVGTNCSTTLVTNCSFLSNSAVMKQGMKSATFSGQTQGGAISLSYQRLIATVHSTTISTCIFMKNIAQNDDNPLSVKGGAISIGLGNVKIIGCSFAGNQGTIGGAIFFGREGPLKIHSCRFHGNNARTGGALVAHSRGAQAGSDLTIERSTLTSNNAMFGGAIHLASKGYRTISNFGNKILECVFVNNSASTTGQSIYSNEGAALQGTSFRATERTNAHHIQFESGVNYIWMVNITINLFRHRGLRIGVKSSAFYLSSSRIIVALGLRVSCPTGFNIAERNSSYDQGFRSIVYTFLTVDCDSCPYNYYTLKSGTYHLTHTPATSIKQWIHPQIETQKCNKCEMGATCDIDVKVVDNYWGYKNGESRLSFEVCPGGYCCSSDTVPCDTYNTCARGRTGVLCGSCTTGYKQSFVTDGCIKKTLVKCDVHVFVVYFIMYTLLHTVIFVCITNAEDVILPVKNGVTSRRRRANSAVNAEENEALEIDSASTKSKPNGDFSIAAFVQITILHFQVASLLKVKFQGGSSAVLSFIRSNDGIRDTVSDIFNFRFSIVQGVCPSDDLTLPEKEMILFGMKLATFLHLLLFGIVFVVVNTLCCSMRERQRKENEKVDVTSLSVIEMETSNKSRSGDGNTEEEKGCLTFIHQLEITFIKFLKMYYTPVTKAALHMIYCVEILGSYHLFVSGDHVCYSPWQLVVMFVIIPGILLFPICFELAIRLLEKRKINSSVFTVAILCPFYAIYLYALEKVCGGEDNQRMENLDEEEFSVRVLEAEQKLFRVVKDCVGWQIVQLYRTFLINLLTTFLTNPVYRSLAFGLAILIFIVHDRRRRPYKCQYLNHLQSLSSRCLLLILVCNVIPSMSFMVNITSTLHVFLAAKILSILELLFYAAVPLSLPIWKIWSVIEEKRGVKMIR